MERAAQQASQISLRSQKDLMPTFREE